MNHVLQLYISVWFKKPFDNVQGIKVQRSKKSLNKNNDKRSFENTSVSGSVIEIKFNILI